MKNKERAIEELDHYCSYNGITDENKEELLRIIETIKTLENGKEKKSKKN